MHQKDACIWLKIRVCKSLWKKTTGQVAVPSLSTQFHNPKTTTYTHLVEGGSEGRMLFSVNFLLVTPMPLTKKMVQL